MDEVELSLSQAENKYDYYVENCKKLQEENGKLSEEMEKKIKEQQQSIIEMRKGMSVFICVLKPDTFSPSSLQSYLISCTLLYSVQCI